ncbi:MAG: hypothetical protein RL113_650, partial [Pseudomonadota bacterium]
RADKDIKIEAGGDVKIKAAGDNLGEEYVGIPPQGVPGGQPLGYGGHTSLILDSHPDIHVIGIDQDETAIEFSTKKLAKYGSRVEIKKGRFSDVIKEILKEQFN